MNVLIYGAGALGQALGCMLVQAGYSVDLILRQRFIGAIKQNGLSVTGVMGEFAVSGDSLGLFGTIEETEKEYDYAIITTKTYDTEMAAQKVASLGSRVSNVVSMQNGCGNLEVLQQHFETERCLGARVITGFEIKSPGSINISVTADAIHVGGCGGGLIPSTAKILANSIAKSGHPCIAVEDINVSLYAKLLYNCALNPLGAVLGVHYGALAENEDSRKILNRVIDETFAVVVRLGGKVPWSSAEQYKETFYETLIPATYNHRASMLQDLENGKPTEVEALAGYVSRMGKLNLVPTPTCDLLAAMVRFKEAQVQR